MMDLLRQLDIKNIIRDLAFVSFMTYWSLWLADGVFGALGYSAPGFIVFYAVNCLTALVSLVLIGFWAEKEPIRHIGIVSVLLWIISLKNVDFTLGIWFLDLGVMSLNLLLSCVLAVVIILCCNKKR